VPLLSSTSLFMTRRRPSPPLFPYTTLFRSSFYFTNVEMVPEQRRTIRLNTPEGALIGYAVWELTPVEGGTEVAYHVYSEAVIPADRKSTRLNSSHVKISYAVFCLKKKSI